MTEPSNAPSVPAGMPAGEGARTGKQRVHAALAGRRVDRTPVTVPYNMLYYEDHFAELTGLPAWRREAWQHADPAEHLRLFQVMREKAAFDIVQPQWCPSRKVRASLQFIERDGRPFRINTATGDEQQIVAISGHAKDYKDQEQRNVWSKADVDAIAIPPSAQRLAAGRNDYLDAVVRAFGRDHFILGGGVIGTVYSCSWHVGLTNVFAMMAEEADLLDYLCQNKCDENLEEIRAIAAAGGDAIYIDDATSTCDMISRSAYERFSLPYMQRMVEEIHRLNHKAILIYFGGIADRLDLIARTGADGLMCEATMKGFVNDIAHIAEAVGDRMTIFANVDPVGILQNAGDEALEAEMCRQAAAGKRARGFVMSTGSPITPSTPLARVRKFIDLGHRI